MLNKSSFPLFLAVSISLLTGCTVLGDIFTDSNKSSTIAHYAEEVFRRQNNATSQIMTLSPDEFANQAQYEALLSAEKNMHSACELLNDYAQRVQDGKDANWYYRSRVGAEVKNCDHATQQLETMLENLNFTASSFVTQGTGAK